MLRLKGLTSVYKPDREGGGERERERERGRTVGKLARG